MFKHLFVNIGNYGTATV